MREQAVRRRRHDLGMTFVKVNAVTVDGVIGLELDDDERSLAAQHLNAATYYRDTGRTDRLDSFRGVSVGGHELETDSDELQRLAALGQLDFEDFYEG